MKHLIIASPTILAALVVLAISLHAVYRARRENKEHKAECERWKAEFERQLAVREAELMAQFAAKSPEHDTPDEHPQTELPATAQFGT